MERSDSLRIAGMTVHGGESFPNWDNLAACCVSTCHSGAVVGEASLCGTTMIEFDVEEDGRWIAEIPELPGDGIRRKPTGR